MTKGKKLAAALGYRSLLVGKSEGKMLGESLLDQWGKSLVVMLGESLLGQ